MFLSDKGGFINLYEADLFYLTTTPADEIHDGMNLELYYQ